ncbi:MAG: DUF2339 domain-containing protein [Lachnospiraceae bacterium]|nr:DUF2339 domain-containing protein [Lachnospiraceae bacterium]
MTLLFIVGVIVFVGVSVGQQKRIENLEKIVRILEEKSVYYHSQIEALKGARGNSAERGRNGMADNAAAGRTIPTTESVRQSGEVVSKVSATTPAQPYAPIPARRESEGYRPIPASAEFPASNKVPPTVPAQPYAPIPPRMESEGYRPIPASAEFPASNKVPPTVPAQPYAPIPPRMESEGYRPIPASAEFPASNKVPPTVPAQPYAPIQKNEKTQKLHPTDLPKNQQKEKPKKAKFTLESLLGARVFSIFASVLIYIGLIFLGTLDIPSPLRIAIMYFVCGSATAFGIWLTKKHRTFFSLGLTGCGLGSLFISILLTHMYFHAISDVASFALLIVWTAVTLVISKKLDSLVLSVTAHAGMMISVGFVFALGFSEDRILLPVIYQAVSIAVIIVGNIFCCRKTYRFGLLTSMVAMLYSSASMVRGLHLFFGTCGISVNTVLGLFVFQFIGMSFLSYLLSVSATKLKSEQTGNMVNLVSNRDFSNAVHVINKSLWVASAVFNIYVVFAVCLTKMAGYSYIKASSITFAVFTAVIIAHTILTVIMGIKLSFNPSLETISLYFLAFTQALAIIVFNVSTFKNVFTFVVAVAAAVVLVWRLTHNKHMESIALILLGMDALFTIPLGYVSILWSGRHTYLGETARVEMIPVCVLHALLVAVLLFIMYHIKDEESRKQSLLSYKLYGYIWSVLATSSIILSAGNSFIFVLLAWTVLHIVLQVICYAKNTGRILGGIINAFSLSIMGIMVLFGFNDMRNMFDNTTVFILVTAAYILLVSCTIVYLWVRMLLKDKESDPLIYKTILYLWVTAAIASFMSVIGFKFTAVIFVIMLIHIVLYMLHYGNGKSNYLRVIMNCASLSMMAIMVFGGFNSFIHNGFSINGSYRYMTDEVAVVFNICFAVLLAATVAVAIGMLAVTSKRDKTGAPLIYKTILYLWVTAAVASLMNAVGFKFIAAIYVIMLIHVVLYMIHYGKGESSYLRIIMNCASLLMMAIMVFGGFNSFIHNGFSINGNYRYMTNEVAVVFNTCFAVLLAAAVAVAIGMLAVTSKKDKTGDPLIYKTILYLWVTAAVASLMNAVGFKFIAAIYVIMLIHVVLYMIHYGKGERSYLRVIMNCASLSIMAIMVFGGFNSFIHNGFSINGNYKYMTNEVAVVFNTCFAVLLAAAVAVAIGMLAVTSKKDKTGDPLIYKTILYLWVTAAVASLMNAVGFKFIAAIYVIMLIHVVLYMIHYGKGERSYLRVIMNCASLSIMAIMVFGGFNSFIHNGFSINGSYRYMTNEAAVLFNTCCAVILAAAVTTVLGMLASASSREGSPRLSELYKMIIYLWCNTFVLSITVAGDWGDVIALVILIMIHLVLVVCNKKDNSERVFYVTTTIGSLILILISCMYISSAKEHNNEMIRYFLLIISAAALFSVKAYRALLSKNTSMEIGSGLIFTVFVCSVTSGLSDTLSATYIMSIVGMITALICIIMGFVLQSKGLRVYGLVVVILFVIKLITIDITSSNSVERVVSFIIGGIICFIISGIYTRLEKKYQDKVTVPVPSNADAEEVQEQTKG